MAFAMGATRRRTQPEKRRDLSIRVPKQERAPASANILLLKSPLGKARAPVYDLPRGDYVYGRKVDKQFEDSAALATQGYFNAPPAIKPPVQLFDYVTVNRAAIKQGVVTAKGNAAFRQSHPVYLRTGEHSKMRMEQSRRAGLPNDRNPWHTYGKPSDMCTPVGALLTDVFSRDWLEEQQRKEEQRADRERQRKSKSKMMAKMLQPRPPPRRKPAVEKDPSELYKMKRFTTVNRKVDTHWAKNEDNAYNRIAAERAAALAAKATAAEKAGKSRRKAETAATPEATGRTGDGENAARQPEGQIAEDGERTAAEVDGGQTTHLNAGSSPSLTNGHRHPGSRRNQDSAKRANPIEAYLQPAAGKPNDVSWNVQHGVNMLCWNI